MAVSPPRFAFKVTQTNENDYKITMMSLQLGEKCSGFKIQTPVQFSRDEKSSICGVVLFFVVFLFFLFLLNTRQYCYLAIFLFV